MAPRALIIVNGSVGSNSNLPINTLVNLSNSDAGGELTYLWSIADQPEGTADALSATTIESPTFTPLKEGTYLLKLVVNQGLSTESTNTVIVGIRQLKSFGRIPAALETIEDSSVTGWKLAVNRQLQQLDKTQGDANLIVAQVPDATFAVGQVVALSSTAVIKAGLPGQETVLVAAHALALTGATFKYRLGVIERTVKGGAAATGDLVLVRVEGFLPVTFAGAPAVGDPIYASDTGTVSLTAGTDVRQIGVVVFVSGGLYSIYLKDRAVELEYTLGPAGWVAKVPASATLGAGEWTITNTTMVGSLFLPVGALITTTNWSYNPNNASLDMSLRRRKLDGTAEETLFTFNDSTGAVVEQSVQTYNSIVASGYSYYLQAIGAVAGGQKLLGATIKYRP